LRFGFNWARRGCLPGLILAAVIFLIGYILPKLGVGWATQKVLAPIIAIGVVVILFMWTAGAPREDGSPPENQPPPRGWTEEDQRRHERLRRTDAPPEDDEDRIRPEDFRR